MSFSLQQYHQKKNQLIQKIDQYSFVLKEMNDDVEHNKMMELRKQLLEDQFQIVVVGEFSRGKSTFINALLGKKVLPSSAKPTTATLNIITYSDVPKITLHYHDEHLKSEVVTEERFKVLVAPKDPIEGDVESERTYQNHVQELQAIKFAEIGDPLSFCANGVTIIDTPGTNDLDPAREQVTNNIIPKSDAAILILSAIKILSESEISFLRDRLLANDIQKIFVVINFKDDLENKAAEQKVLDYAHTHLKGILNDPKVFLVSAKHALNARRKENGEELVTKRGKPISSWDLKDTGFPELEENLADFLQHERGAVKLMKPIARVQKGIKEKIQKQINLEKQALHYQMNDLQEKVDSFRPKLKKVKEIGEEAQRKITFELEREEQELLKWYEQELYNITNKGMETFEEYRYLGLNEITRKVENAIAPLERDLHVKKKEKISRTVKATVKKMSTSVNQEWFKLEGDLQNIYEPSQDGNLLPSTSINIEQEYEYSIFDEIFEELDTAWENSNSFLGKLAIGAGFVATFVIGGIASLFKAGWAFLTGEDEKTKLKRKLRDQFDSSRKQKMSSFKQEWSGIVKAVKEQYKQTIDENVQKVEQQLNSMIQHTKLEEIDIQKKMEVINRRESNLKAIERELSSLNQELARPQKVKVEVS